MSAAARDRLAAAVATLAVAGAVAVGVYLLRSPAEERQLRLDERRVAELVALANGVDVYWRRHERLPASIEELKGEPLGRLVLNDPASGRPYEYAPLSGRRFEVCATFERDSAATNGVGSEGFWAHHAGRQCFAREAGTVER